MSAALITPGHGLIPSAQRLVWAAKQPLGTTAQLPAHHAGILQVPAIITDGTPGALVKDLHSPGTPVQLGP